MSEHNIVVSPPVSCGGRDFYPVIRVFHLTSQSGGWISGTPIALIIEEGGIWSFVTLEEGIQEEIITRISALQDMSELKKQVREDPDTGVRT